jgi:hypothetical protein
MSQFGGRLQADFGSPTQNSYRALPQGGFQSVNATVSAQEQCKIQLPNENIVYAAENHDINETNKEQTKTQIDKENISSISSTPKLQGNRLNISSDLLADD